MTDTVKNFWAVRDLASSISSGGRALANVPDAVKQVIATDAWRHYLTDSGREFHHDNFESFATTAPFGGLGCKDIGQLDRLCADDPEARRLLQEVRKGKRGRKPPEEKPTNGRKLNPIHGNTQGYTLDRLHRDHPELYRRVVDGELSANAAAIEAGFRKRLVQVEPTVDGVFRMVQKRFTDEQLLELKDKL